MTQCYLKKDTPELSIIGGIGEFAAHLPALPVPESIANQYDTEEMRGFGWVVMRVPDDHAREESPSRPPQEDTAPVADSFRTDEAPQE